MSTLIGVLRELLEKPEVSEEEVRQRLSELLASVPRPRKMTYEDFLDWADEDTPAEWVDGEIIMVTPVSNEHQDIVDFLTSILRTFVETRRLGRVLSAPFQMKLARSGREPDLLFIANEHLDRLKEAFLDGPADLVVEVVSPESAGRDRGEKFYEYEAAGIPEYWLIDPVRQQSEFYQLDETGRYHLVPPDAEGIYHSRVLPGFRLRITWLWDRPQILDALRELGVLS